MSNGALIMRSKDDRWYLYPISFKSFPSHVLPRLEEGWTKQDSIEVILNTCGKGVKMVFMKTPPEPGSSFETCSSWGWHDGDNFDHSPEWSHSPEHPDRHKVVAEDYYKGPHPRPKKYYESEEAAIASSTKPHLYVWNGEKWRYHNNKKPAARRGNIWGRGK
jgi:hypothetical protein